MLQLPNRHNKEGGSILLVFLITLPFLTLIVLYYTSLSLTSYQVGRLDQFRSAAQLAADAGADYAVGQISQNNAWSGSGGDVTLHSDSKMLTKYNVTVTGDDTAKTIAVTGKTFFPVTDSTPKRTVKIYVDLRPVSSGLFSVISGAGGLIMSNSSKVVGGDVFINGGITMSNSAQIGLSTTPVNVKVAHQSCPEPADATYPRVCASGENGQPIEINNSAHIYGEVQATNQTNGSNMSNTGLVSGSTVAPQALPSHDRAAQKAAITTNTIGTAASCSGNQTRTWAANTKITGDVKLSNSCTVTIEGNVWITGKLELENSSRLIVSNTVGATRPNIMVDAKDTKLKNNTAIVNNSSGTGVQIISYWSNASCSPDCADVTGVDLKDSRNELTIELDNSATGTATIFYSRWSKVMISNSGQIGALVGQTIELKNNSTITFGTSLGTGDVTWVVKGYRRQ